MLQTSDTFIKLSNQYDLFLFDVYGVIHKGQGPIASTLNVLKNLHLKGKSVGLISNSPLMIDVLRDKLRRLGIPPTYYQVLMTAGAVTHAYLKHHRDPLHARLGPYCYFIGQIHEEEILQDTPFIRVESLDEADFILMTSMEEWYPNLQDYDQMLRQALALKLPFVCANPDLLQFHEQHPELRAGSVAEAYHKMGGKVIFHGKPHRDIFHEILERYSEIPKQRILMVGDSLKTDLKACEDLGLDCFLLLGDLTRYEMHLDLDSSFEKAVHQLKDFRYTPKYVSENLEWD